jgi:putative sterol carrier protein
MMCHPDEAEAIERGIDGAHFFGYSLAHYYVFGDHRPGRTNIYDEFERRRDEVGFARSVIRAEDAPLGVRVLQQGLGSLRGAIGTPDQIRDLCRRYDAAGVDQVVFVLQAGRNRHEHICESLQTFGAEVLPEFAATADAADAARDAELAGPIDAALRRRAPPRTAAPGYAIAPIASGPPVRGAAAGGDGGRRTIPRPGLAALRRLAKDGGEQAFQAFVRRASDDRLEATAGSERGLNVVFAAMARAYEPDQAHGFAGELQYDLARRDGKIVHWTVRVDPHRATVRPGPAGAPALTLKMTVADFLRMAASDLDAGKALLTGRLDLAGDFALAQRLGEMFGQSAAL